MEWLLGEEVYGNVVRNDRDVIIYRPTWPLLLSYEYQVRRKALWFVNNEGCTVVEALRMAKKHEATAQKYFTTPMALSAGAAAATAAVAASSAGARSRSPKNNRPRDGMWAPAAHSKPAKKGQQGDQKSGWKSWTKYKSEDGKLRCFKFQRGTCTDTSAEHLRERPHECQLCGSKDHGLKACPRR